MAPKKKKLSPEEKKKLLAEKKLQKKLAAEEAKRQIKRDHLLRELQYGELNRAKLEKQWKDMLLKISLPKLKAEIEMSMNLFERALDLKDSQINKLKIELDEAEEQYQINFRAHCEEMEKLLDIFHDTISSLKQNYDSCVKELFEETMESNNLIENRSLDVEDYLKLLNFRMDYINNSTERTILGECMTKYDSITKQAFDDLQLLRATEERSFESVWEEYDNTLKEYSKHISEKIDDYNQLFEVDKQKRAEIVYENACIRKAHDFIKIFQFRRRVTRCDLEEEIADMIIDKKNYDKDLHDCKKHLDEDIRNDTNRINLLTRESNKAINYFQKLYKTSEAILKWKLHCRRYETQEDRVKISTENIEPNNKIDRFASQLAKVKIQKLKLLKKKQELLNENNALKAELQRYCEEANCACKNYDITKQQKPIENILMDF